LINSIPEPDPERAWADDALEDGEDYGEVAEAQLEFEHATTVVGGDSPHEMGGQKET
jgi:hypothetical protein